MFVASMASEFIDLLWQQQSDDELRKIRRYFKAGEGEYGHGDRFIGVRMGEVFQLAKMSGDMPILEIEKLLESDIHEARAGALRIMANQATSRKATPELREQLFNLYVRRHDRINNWDLVDLAAAQVVGRWLLDRPRDLLYNYAHSENLWERRTAVYALAPMIRNNDLDDVYAIAEILIGDHEDLIQKAVGAWLRFAGDKDKPRLEDFLRRHAAEMPRVMLRTAIEKFPADERKLWLASGKK